MKIIDNESLAAEYLERAPFRYMIIDRSLKEDAIGRMGRTFPTDNYELTQRSHGTDKTYIVESRPAVRLNARLSDGAKLDPIWEEFIEDVMSAEYRDLLSSVFGRSLEGDLIDIGFYRYPRGGYVSPHRDKPGKSCGHVFYFNEVWDRAWGGMFRILGSQDDTDVVKEIVPRLGRSILFERSDVSWHSVTAVEGDLKRLAVHVDFWKEDPGVAEGRVILADRK